MLAMPAVAAIAGPVVACPNCKGSGTEMGLQLRQDMREEDWDHIFDEDKQSYYWFSVPMTCSCCGGSGVLTRGHASDVTTWLKQNGLWEPAADDPK